MQKLPAKILIVDDDPDVLNTARVVLRQKFESVETETNPQRLHFLLQQQRYDVILLDMNFTSGKTTGNEGLFWLKEILSIRPGQQVIMMTAYGDIKIAVDAMKQGASDFIVKPWDNEKLESTVRNFYQFALTQNELQQLKSKHSGYNRVMQASDTEVLGDSPAMLEVLKLVDKVSAADANVLLLGENGTGKELIAKLIHQRSSRKHEPFIKVDVGSLSPTLFESELFGHKKGSFTDAREDRVGRIELAHGGTLFLDEVGNLPLSLQSKLLSVLQSREVVPLGASASIPVDIRLICATNIDIRLAVDSGAFREDLLYRINTVTITLPPLRQRTEDIPILAAHFLQEYVTKYRKENKRLTDEAISALTKYQWPGNIRELRHAIERAVIMSEQTEITRKDLMLTSTREITEKKDELHLDTMERKAIIMAIQKYQGNMSKVAKELGVGRTTLYRKMAKYGIEK